MVSVCRWLAVGTLVLVVTLGAKWLWLTSGPDAPSAEQVLASGRLARFDAGTMLGLAVAALVLLALWTVLAAVECCCQHTVACACPCLSESERQAQRVRAEMRHALMELELERLEAGRTV